MPTVGTAVGDGVDAVLADGGLVHLRSVRPDDRPALLALHGGLSERSAYLRFFSLSSASSIWFVERVTRPPGEDRAGLVALVDGRLVGLAAYEQLTDRATAEISFTVEDDQQGRGVATLLLEHLVAHARARGVRRFVAEMLSDNAQMLQVFTDAGLSVHRALRDGVIEVSLALSDDEAYHAAVDERDAQATVRSLIPLLRPESVAVVGAGRTPRKVGHEVLRNLLQAGFVGPVYPVNPRADRVFGLPAYPSVSELPEGVDLVVVAVPADAVLGVISACGRRGVRSIVVLSAGFADSDEAGAARERAVLAAARAAGMRLVGPNCLGVANSAPDVRLDATFAVTPPPPGRIGVATQSGGLGLGLLQGVRGLGLGVSTFVSFGNKADVSANDLLLWFEQDTSTDLIVLYLESFGNPRRFARVARRVGRVRPVVAVKGGRSAVGSHAVRSHTAAAANAQVSTEALFDQAGVVAVETLGELFEVVALLARQPLPAGPGLAVVSNAGGPCVLAADAASAAGLALPTLGAATQQVLRELLPAGAAVTNPVDAIASVSGPAFARTLAAVLADPAVDAALAVVTPTPLTDPDELTRAVVTAARDAGGRPLAAAVLGQPEAITTLLDPDGRPSVPSYAFPEAAARALARAHAHARWRSRPPGRLPNLGGIDRPRADALVRGALAARPGGGWLSTEHATALAAAYGIRVAPVTVAGSAEAAAEAATRLGLPVALKAEGPDLVHKSDLGGVHLALASPAEVAAAYRAAAARLGAQMTGAVVQPMVPAGVEVVIGVVEQPAFGPLVTFGLGGVATDLLGDHGFRLLPLTDSDAAELVRSVRTAPLLFGYRGGPPVDVPALEELLLRVARLADDVPELVELDLNPVVASARGAVVVDVTARLAPAPPPADPFLRQLE